MKKILLLIFICFSAACFAQRANISGLVIDKETQKPVAGVTIKSASGIVTTDSLGNFTINASRNEKLEVSHVSMSPLIVQIPASGSFIIELSSVAADLSEVVVTGYSTEKKKDITGAVSVVKMKDIASIPTGNVMSALQGRVPGVNISTDGTPGGVGTGVSIRGITTINNSTPLYVIDGVQTRTSGFLNPSDIESIQILKDAASASIYGTQAANGVIIITTKRAAKNQTRVDFDARYSFQKYHTNIEMLNAQQWGDVYWKAYKNDGVQPRHDIYGNGATPVIPEFIDLKKTIRSGNTNWADEVYKPSLLQEYNVSVSRGGESGGSVFSLNYFDQDGLIKYTNYTRFTLRLNSDYRFLNNRFRIGENLNLNKISEKVKPGGIEELAIAQHPIIPVYDINGGYAGPTQGLGDKPNPVRLLNEVRQNRNNQWRIMGNAYAELEPIKNLVLRSNFSLNYGNGFYSSFAPKWKEGDRTVNKNSLYTKSDYGIDWIWSNTIAYNRDFDKHHLSVLGGTEAKESRGEFIDAAREDYLIEVMDYRYLSAGSGKQTNGGLADRTAMVSYFGKLNYNFASRYLLSGTLRRDASSRFGNNNNAGLFPAVSAGWRISDEFFMKDLSFLSSLLLRASWGKNGNDQIDNEATYTKYGINLAGAGYDIAGIQSGVIPTGITKLRSGNPNVHWEITTQTNLGFDLALLQNKLYLTLDYYVKKTEGMLIDRPYIAVIGEGGYMAYNGASLKNNGFEGVLTWRERKGNDFSYEVNLTGTAYKNKITGLPEEIYYTWGGGNGIDKSIVGQPLGSWMGYRTNGLYRTSDDLNDGINQSGKALGRIRYVDTNGDKVINDKDREWLGTDLPRFTGGLNVAVTYKSFDVAFLLNGVVRKAYNNSKFYTDFFQLWTGNHSTRLLQAWDADANFNSTIPALTAVNLNDEGRLSEYFLENGNYIKLKNLQLGYTLPGSIAKRASLRNMRMYLQAQDLFTITKYTGADPEGLGYPYPIPRTFTFGINFGF